MVISVLIPAYNAGLYLRMSVQSILDQTYRDLEVIVIDDGSTDGSVDRLQAEIQDPRLHIFRQPNSGQATAKNHGLSHMAGDFWMTQDADDVSHPERIERQVCYLMEHPDVAAVLTGHEFIIGRRVVAPRAAGKSTGACGQDVQEFRMPAHGPTAMFRVAMVRDLRFDPTLRVAEDVDYFWQVAECYPVAVMEGCLYSYRVDLKSSSRRNPAGRREMERRAVAKACLRRGWDPALYLPAPIDTHPRFAHRYSEQVVPDFLESVLEARRDGRRLMGLRAALVCARLHPLDPYYYKPLVYCLVPLGTIELYRRCKKEVIREARRAQSARQSAFVVGRKL